MFHVATPVTWRSCSAGTAVSPSAQSRKSTWVVSHMRFLFEHKRILESVDGDPRLDVPEDAVSPSLSLSLFFFFRG